MKSVAPVQTMLEMATDLNVIEDEPLTLIAEERVEGKVSVSNAQSDTVNLELSKSKSLFSQSGWSALAKDEAATRINLQWLNVVEPPVALYKHSSLL